MMIPDTLQTTLRTLRLSGLQQTLDVRLQEAGASQLTHLELRELLLQDELNLRQQRKIERRTKSAGFREQCTLERFDFAFNRSINRAQIFELATCSFIRESRCVLFIGPPGVGKSHLAQAIGNAAIRQDYTVLYRSVFDVARDFIKDEAMQGHSRILQQYLKTDLLIIDDMGMKERPRQSGEHLMEVIMRRHGLKSTIMTSNRPLEDWGKLLGDNTTATAILDRFLESAEVIVIKGRSYRIRNQAACKGSASPEEAHDSA
jgi:DNA replication protein DnaC